MTGDPFAASRRALWLGPAVMAAGGAIVFLGISGSGLAWIVRVVGGLLVLGGFLRFVAGVAVLLIERRRVRVLAEGTPATATITGLREVRRYVGWPIYDMELTITRPDGSLRETKRRGAIPVQYAGALSPGDELPIRLAEDGETFAADWDQL